MPNDAADTPQPAPAVFLPDALLEKLAAGSGQLEQPGAWPKAQLQWLAEAGVLRWGIPERFGGVSVSQADLIAAYRRLAGACLVTTFILTQRQAAVQRILEADAPSLQDELLPALAAGTRFATVGISHLTTSRQHLQTPAVAVHQREGGFEFQGQVPWITGAAYADYIVTGGLLSNQERIMAAVRRDSAGLHVHPAAELLALNASHTAAVDLQGVLVPEHDILKPAAADTPTRSATGTGSYVTSALAVGLSRATLDHLQAEAARRGDLVDFVRPLESEYAALEETLTAAARETGPVTNPAHTTEAVRSRANLLVLRTTQAWLAASKGAGFVAGHPAERAVREALFFLVWSCPQPVLHATLRELAGMPVVC